MTFTHQQLAHLFPQDRLIRLGHQVGDAGRQAVERLPVEWLPVLPGVMPSSCGRGASASLAPIVAAVSRIVRGSPGVVVEPAHRLMCVLPA
jgi:hypothetical protein